MQYLLWKKSFVFWFKFCSMKYVPHGPINNIVVSVNGLTPNRQQAITWTCSTNPAMHQCHIPHCNVHISVTKWCIVGYLSDALWDLWDGSIMHICITRLQWIKAEKTAHATDELGTRFIYYIKRDYKYQLGYIIKKQNECSVRSLLCLLLICISVMVNHIESSYLAKSMFSKESSQLA